MMQTTFASALFLLAATTLGAQSTTTRSVGNPNLGAHSTLSADTFSGANAGGTCESKLRNRTTGNTLVKVDARVRRQGYYQHDQRVRLYIGDTLLFYRNRISSRLCQENANESIASFETQTIGRDFQNATGGEAGSGGSLVELRWWVSTTIGARGQLMAASARNGSAVGADADFRTWAWCSSASAGSAPATVTNSEVDTTMNVNDRLWFTMLSAPHYDGGTLHAMPSDNYVYQRAALRGFFFPNVRHTPSPIGMVPIPYPMIFDESVTLVNDSKTFPHRVFAVN